MADYIQGTNMTNFFNRELFMYSLGDIQFKKPISLKKMIYTMFFLLIWTLPIVMIFGIKFSPFYMAFILGPPILGGIYATKPIFEGKALLDFVKTIGKYLSEPKGWTDLRNDNNMGNMKYYVENEIWVSRRRELNELNRLKEARSSKRKFFKG